MTLFKRVNKFLGKNVKFWSLMKTIEELVAAGEMLVEENGAMAEKHAEKDIALNDMKVIIQGQQETIEQYKLQETILLERLKKQTLQLKEMQKDRRLTRFYEMAEENLKLAQENAGLKELVKS